MAYDIQKCGPLPAARVLFNYALVLVVLDQHGLLLCAKELSKKTKRTFEQAVQFFCALIPFEGPYEGMQRLARYEELIARPELLEKRAPQAWHSLESSIHGEEWQTDFSVLNVPAVDFPDLHRLVEELQHMTAPERTQVAKVLLAWFKRSKIAA